MSRTEPAVAAACAAFDAILAERPEIEHEQLSAAVRQVIDLRDGLIAERRSGRFPPEREDLLHKVNSALSLANAAQFPLVGIKWDRIVAVRDTLRQLSESPAGRSPTP